MSTTPESINPNLCPICQQDNRCGNLAACSSDESCWCTAPDISFSEQLLQLVPSAGKNKACICKACALANIHSL
ncbi:MAG: cysteine-rich CWC family protein [Thalassotalea sp.]